MFSDFLSGALPAAAAAPLLVDDDDHHQRTASNLYNNEYHDWESSLHCLQIVASKAFEAEFIGTCRYPQLHA
jgi:hypothetical protein